MGPRPLTGPRQGPPSAPPALLLTRESSRFLAPFPPLMSRHSWGAREAGGQAGGQGGWAGRGERGACQLSRDGAVIPQAHLELGLSHPRCGSGGLQV